jgi:hypothetical protein
MQNGKLIATMVLSFAVFTGVSAQQKRGMSLTAQDYVDIQQLYTRYHWIADARDGEAWANLFTVDGVFESGGTKTTGREKLAALPAQGLGEATAASPLRFVTNVRIEPSPEGARGGAYLLHVAPGGGPSKPATITNVVVYEDILVKTSEGWRLKYRKVYANTGLAPSKIPF